MARGISTANLANPNLDWLRGVSPPSIAGLFVKLHIGDPGASGTANASAVTTRRQATMNAASGGSITLASMSGNWSMTATESISDISVWDTVGPAGGNFLFSAQVTVTRNVINGDTIAMTALTVSNTPLAA